MSDLEEFNCPNCNNLCRYKYGSDYIICDVCENNDTNQYLELRTNKFHHAIGSMRYQSDIGAMIVDIKFNSLSKDYEVRIDDSQFIEPTKNYKFDGITAMDFTQNNLAEQLSNIIKPIFKRIKMENFK